MPAGDFVGPYQLFACADNCPKRGNNKPERDEQGYQGVEIGATYDRDKKAGHYWRQRYKNIADVVEVGEAYRCVVTARATEQTYYAPVGACGCKTHYDRNKSQDLDRMKKPINCLPNQQGAHSNQTDGAKEVRGAHEVSGQTLRQDKRQVQKHERQLVGKVVNAVHDEAQASSLEAGYGLGNKDSRVERDGGGERFAVMSHVEITFSCYQLSCAAVGDF